MTAYVLPYGSETWLVCGGRDFTDAVMFASAMLDLVEVRGALPRKIVHGAATGADSLADVWGRRFAIEVVRVPAQWEKDGRAAGPVRNQQMLDEYKPDLCVAFPGGRGTADMIARARKAGVTVAEIERKS